MPRQKLDKVVKLLIISSTYQLSDTYKAITLLYTAGDTCRIIIV